jgi:hypothetical protein
MKKTTLERKARHTAAHFYYRPDRIAGYIQDWIDMSDEGLDVDTDVKDLAKLLVKFHKDCNTEKL